MDPKTMLFPYVTQYLVLITMLPRNRNKRQFGVEAQFLLCLPPLSTGYY